MPSICPSDRRKSEYIFFSLKQKTHGIFLLLRKAFHEAFHLFRAVSRKRNHFQNIGELIIAVLMGGTQQDITLFVGNIGKSHVVVKGKHKFIRHHSQFPFYLHNPFYTIAKSKTVISAHHVLSCIFILVRLPDPLALKGVIQCQFFLLQLPDAICSHAIHKTLFWNDHGKTEFRFPESIHHI